MIVGKWSPLGLGIFQLGAGFLLMLVCFALLITRIVRRTSDEAERLRRKFGERQ